MARVCLRLAAVCHGAEVIPACANHAEICCNHSSVTEFLEVPRPITRFAAKVGGKLVRIQNRIQLQDLKMLAIRVDVFTACCL
jgi:hypothetical protein